MSWTKVHRTQLDVNGTTPLALTNSPAAASGDILYAAVTTFTTDVVTGPSGWSVIATADVGAGEAKIQLWKKVAGAGEGTSYSWSSTGGTLTCIDFFQLTGADATTQEDVTPSTHVLGTGQSSITATTVTTVTDGAMLIAWWLESGAAQSITADASMSAEANLLATGFPLALGSGSLTQTTHGATGDKTGSWTPLTTSAGAILLAVRPAASGPKNYLREFSAVLGSGGRVGLFSATMAPRVLQPEFRMVGLLALYYPRTQGTLLQAAMEPGLAHPERTRYPTVGVGGFMNPENAFTTDSLYATQATPPSNGTSATFRSFGFDGVLPADATVTRVEAIVRIKADINDPAAGLEVDLYTGLYDSGTILFAGASTVERTYVIDVSHGSGFAALVASDFYDANLNLDVACTSATKRVGWSINSAAVRLTWQVDELTKQARRPIPATQSFAGSIARGVNAVRQATLSFIGGLPRQTSRTITAILSFVGAAATVFTPGGIHQLLQATLSFSGSVTKQTTHVMPATLSFVGATTRFIARGLTATASFVGATTKQTRRALAATLALVGSFLRGRVMTATLSFVGAITKQTAKPQAATLSFVGIANRLTRRGLTATLLGTSSTVAFQSVGNNRVASTTVTIAAFDPGSGANRLLVVFIGSDFDRSSTMAVTYGGTALTLVPGTRGGAGAAWSEFWYLINPSSTPSDVVATWTSTANISMAALAFNGVNQTTAVQNGGTVGGSGSTPNVTITSAANDMTVAGVTGQLAMSASTQTERWNDTGSNAMTAGSTAPGAATVNHQWTTTAGFSNQISGLDVVAFTSGAGGALSKQTRRILAGTLSFVGTVATIKAFGRLLQATLSFVGTTAKQTTHVMPATVALVGATTRAITRGLTATLALLGTTTKRTSRALAATLPLIGAATRQVGKALAGTASFVGAIPARTIGKLLPATLALIGALSRRTSTTRAATLALVGAATKQTSRTLTAILASVGALATLKAFGRTLVATLSFSGAQTRQTGKALGATVALVGAITSRAVVHQLAATLALAGTVARQTRRTLAATLAPLGSLTISRVFAKALAATLSFVGAATKQTTHALTGTLLSTGATTRGVGKLLSATLAPFGTALRSVTRTLTAATLGLVGATYKQTRKIPFLASLRFTSFFDGSKSTIKTITLAATLAFSGIIRRMPVKSLGGALPLSGSLGQSWLGHIRAATEYVVTILGRIAYAATHRGADARVETIRGATAYYPAIRGATAYRHA